MLETFSCMFNPLIGTAKAAFTPMLVFLIEKFNDAR